MIKKWIVICDYCKKEFNAIKEPFYEDDNGLHECIECNNNQYIIKENKNGA